MSRIWVTFVIAGALCAAAPPSAGAAAGDDLVAVNEEFTAYDPNGDGTPEIRWARRVGVDADAESGERCRGTVLLLVDPRLLDDRRASAEEMASIRPSLQTFAADLATEGWRVRTTALSVYDGPRHQDGRTLLAMRQYLRRVKETLPDLAGVLLVGGFPEAMLVRQYNWRQQRETVLFKGKENEQSFGGKKVYRIVSRPEIVAHRCELVLADLDGCWEDLYHEGPDRVPWAVAVYADTPPPVAGTSLDRWMVGGPTPHCEMGTQELRDYFFVNDGQYTTRILDDGRIDFRPLDDRQDAECAPADQERGNPLARPDLLVSRMDARHVALKPKASIRGTKGEGLLDAAGMPQVVTFAGAKETPRGTAVWEWDPALERRLLVEYFERNHRYRHGAFDAHAGIAAASHGLPSPMRSLRAALPQGLPAADLHSNDATLAAVVRWLKQPALLRVVCAHSDPWGSNYRMESDAAALEQECGGRAWSWIRRESRLEPTLGPAGKLDFPILRTLWQNNALPDTASLYLHWGCEAISPGGAATLPYSDPGYAHWQGGEALLFYARGLALVGRAKVFYDFPTGFARVLAEGGTFGEAWAHYHEVESAAEDVAKVGGGIGRKRAYFWSLLGDWTLKLPQGTTQ